MTIKVNKKRFENNMNIGLKIFGNLIILSLIGAFVYGLIDPSPPLILIGGIWGGVFTLIWSLNDFNSYWLGYLQNKFKLFSWSDEVDNQIGNPYKTEE